MPKVTTSNVSMDSRDVVWINRVFRTAEINNVEPDIVKEKVVDIRKILVNLPNIRTGMINDNVEMIEVG